MSTLEKVAAILQRCSQAAINVKESGCVHGTWTKAVVETSEFRIGKAINLWINLRGSGCSRPRSQQQNEQGFPPAKHMANLFTPAHWRTSEMEFVSSLLRSVQQLRTIESWLLLV